MCQYMCHCHDNDTCDIDGQCLNGCETGWFGLGCQYQDLVNNNDVSIELNPPQSRADWLTDGNDSTCNPSKDLQTIKFIWSGVFYFSWLRVKYNYSSLNYSVTFSFASNYQELSCTNQKLLVINGTTVDYTCNISETIQSLTVSGPGVKALCSIYVSGGKVYLIRIISLAQVKMSQPSDYVKNNKTYSAELAVDGNTDSIFSHGRCSQTISAFYQYTLPTWTVTLDRPRVINRVIVYKRSDNCKDVMENFKVQTMNASDNVLGTYDVYQSLKTIVTISRETVSKIQLALDNDAPFLSFCELMAFGECIPGTWGLDCSQTCPYECSSECHPETGSCFGLCLGNNDSPLCKSGHVNPPECNIECFKGNWGRNCTNSCGIHCYNKTCDKLTGVCDSGCNGYINPPQCNVECPLGKWGHNCAYKCEGRCFKHICHRVTGLCDQLCDMNNISTPCYIEGCQHGFHGENCTLECSSTCKDSICTTNGYCIDCVSGYEGHYCEKVISSGESNVMSFGAGMGIGVAVGAAAVVLMVIAVMAFRCTKRKSHSKTDGQSKTPYDDFQENPYNQLYQPVAAGGVVNSTATKSNPVPQHEFSPEETKDSSIYEVL
ncbi:hypothetical protein Btru_017751 [Bulinus truncatus]|nr:hypothetical protein Btru_017751 [Bulinus truncatus]